MNGYIIVGFNEGDIFVTSDYGEHWTPFRTGMADLEIMSLTVDSTNIYAGTYGGGVWSRPLSELSCCDGYRGNLNMLGIVDLSDLSALVSYLTGGGFELPCNDAANVNGAGIVDLTDLSSLVSYLTGGGYALPNCS